ncbi:helix-turn-helix domain-containing protein [Streptosporangium sp. NPDC020145]|uniref:AraC-like ligand-binding domain-containing protein n=1 Tax=Streptosporangium sp. NPDC020145 TaxID=3154694 RepID=UPI00341D6806
MAATLCPSQMFSDEEECFRGRARVLELEGIQVCALTHPSVWVRRSERMVRQGGPKPYQVHLVLNGEAVVDHVGRRARLGQGQFVLVDTSHPYAAWRSCAPETTSALVVQIPRTLLPLPQDAAGRLIAVPFSASRGMGALFAQWLVGLDQRAEQFGAADASPLASVTVDLLAAVLSSRLDSLVDETPETRKKILGLRIREFIRQNLGDPDLCPMGVAVAHQISLRYLYDIFDAEGMAPAAWIRRLRLERCRSDLSDPRFRTHPVHTIARRWGFTDPAHFSRAFRATYGAPPRHYRHISLPAEPVDWLTDSNSAEA